MNRTWKLTLVCVAVTAGVVAAFLAGLAQAGGIPESGALTYSGLLQDSAGAPLSEPQWVEVKFWNDVTASAPNNQVCDTGTPAAIGLVNGRFSIQLPDQCTTGVGNDPQVWAEVFVGATPSAVASLGRAKIGAVPYAVEASHAVSAVNATMAGTATYSADAGHATTSDTATATSCPDPTAVSKLGFCIWSDDNGSSYSQTYTQAASTCRSKGGRLCTLAEISAAQAAGAEWCAFSWAADRSDNAHAYQAFPMQSSSAGCGSTIGIVSDIRAMTDTLNANCCKP